MALLSVFMNTRRAQREVGDYLKLQFLVLKYILYHKNNYETFNYMHDTKESMIAWSYFDEIQVLVCSCG